MPLRAGRSPVIVAATLAITTTCWLVRPVPSDASEGTTSFSAIQVGRITVAPSTSGTTAVLRVRTSIKAICAVSYGTRRPYGHLATDPSMDPSGDTNHDARLTGLHPNARYLYRIQSVGVDGRLYRSPVYSFRMPARSPRRTSADLALGARVVAVSSVFSPDYAARNAIDGDPTTEWASNGDGNRAYITIDLGHRVHVGSVGFRTRSMSDGTSITRTFTVTVDGRATYGPFPAAPGPRTVKVSFTGRVLRFKVVRSTGGNTGASEIEVYAAHGKGTT